jgi:Asp-tRNA(Asn)/Glu-tRNA(Gln) amidotransferase A subunit family amidase
MLALLSALSLAILAAMPVQDDTPTPSTLTPEQLATAGRVIGLSFSDEELKLMLPGVIENLGSYAVLRQRELDNGMPPALGFTPLLPGITADPWLPERGETHVLTLADDARAVPTDVRLPTDIKDLLFADIPTLSALIRSRTLSCRALVEAHLSRLRAVNEVLHCVITFTEERALAQADALDAELEAGHWRGPLHGIPWGAKDLLAAKGYRTTWGAKPFEHQVIDLDATVVQRLDAAGAVLIAKLSLGALAWGDVWFGETTRNPWNPTQGSSGSSAGPASACAAGGVVFAIGSETLGSIMSPSERCGNSSLRPTFGRVSRHGAMALSWSMDKLGPLCRSLGDAALVLEAIIGPDGKDASVVSQPYAVPGDVDVTGWRVGYVAAHFEDQRGERSQPVLDQLTGLGVELVPIELPDHPVSEMLFVLSAEAAAAFDPITLDGRDDQLVRQIEQAWPNVFRTSRLIPAVEYLQAMRLRTLLCRDMHAVMQDVVAIVHPTYAGGILSLTNLTGHPAAIAPAGFRDNGTPFGITFTGRLYDEARLLALSGAWQRSTEHHKRRP